MAFLSDLSLAHNTLILYDQGIGQLIRIMTASALDQLQANVKAFAIEQGWTKQQTIAFSILAIFDKGYGIARAVEIVCGESGLEQLADIHWTADDLLSAVQDSFFS